MHTLIHTYAQSFIVLVKHNRTFEMRIYTNTHSEIHLAACLAARRRGSASAQALPRRVKGRRIHWEGPESAGLCQITALSEIMCKSLRGGISTGGPLTRCGGFRVRCKHTLSTNKCMQTHLKLALNTTNR